MGLARFCNFYHALVVALGNTFGTFFCVCVGDLGCRNCDAPTFHKCPDTISVTRSEILFVLLLKYAYATFVARSAGANESIFKFLYAVFTTFSPCEGTMFEAVSFDSF